MPKLRPAPLPIVARRLGRYEPTITRLDDAMKVAPLMTTRPRNVLAINTGSSSLKAGLFTASDSAVARTLSIDISNVGAPDSHVRTRDANGRVRIFRRLAIENHVSALQILVDTLATSDGDRDLAAVGHRVVHGGANFRLPVLITSDVVNALKELTTIDPEHLPQAITALQMMHRLFPTVPQVACFDTAFHRSMPRIAQLYGLPRHLESAGVIRYGFHGLSYQSTVQQLEVLDGPRLGGRVIIAHLGSGASMAAIRNGEPMDTTMGFTPTGGLMMGTRSGDLDPGVLVYLLEARGLAPSEISSLVNRQSGLLGVSGTSADMRELLVHEDTDQRAAEAVTLFCYQAKKHLGAMAAVLGGLDTLVFTGGVGEHAASVRERICEGLDYLGISLDGERNRAHSAVASAPDSAVTVRIMHADEELTIAEHTLRTVLAQGANHRDLSI